MTHAQLPIASLQEVWRCVARCARPERLRFTIAALLLATASSSLLAAVHMLGMIIDAVNGGDEGSINRLGIELGLFVLAGVATGFVGRRILAVAIEPTLARLRSEAFSSAMLLRLDTIESVGTADPLSRLTGDIGAISDAAHDLAPGAIMAILSSVTTMVALLLTSPQLGMAALVGAPIFIFAILWFLRNVNTPYLRERAADATVARAMLEIAEGAAPIRSFSANVQWTKTVDAALDERWEARWRPAQLRCVLFPAVTLSICLSLIAVITTGYVMFEHGAISIGTVSVCALYVIQLFAPLTMIMDSLDQLYLALVALRRVVGVTLTDGEGGVSAKTLPDDGMVRLQDVHFAYSSSEDEVLHGISFCVSSGERVAVVGPSGAGKSTIAKLIAGIHEPTAGTIEVGGVRIGAIAETAERRCVALVTQESHVFIGTIADNCRLGKASATDDELRDALAAVQAIEWVDDLPAGIDAAVGGHGISLTLLQAQQIALARVLLANPLVVILDEATAALGTDAARGIERAFGAVLKGRTVVTIAHRLDVAATSDRVIVVDKGSVETGTHNELLGRQSTYATLWNHWLARR